MRIGSRHGNSRTFAHGLHLADNRRNTVGDGPGKQTGQAEGEKKHGLIQWRIMNEEVNKLLQQLNADFTATAEMGALSVALQQMVEIAKALSTNAKIIILDEPTAALTRTESGELYRIVDKLREEGVSIIFISHRFEVVFDTTFIIKGGNHMKKAISFLFTLTLLLIPVTGFAEENKDSINMAIQADATTLDPHMSSAGTDYSYFRMLYDTLIKEENGELVGNLASSWELSEDAMSANFELIPDVKFFDGDTLTSADVVFSMERGSTMAAAQAIPGYKSATVIDDTHFTVEFSAPNPGFFRSLIGFFIVSEDAVTAQGESYGAASNDSASFVGTGPYTLTERSTGSSLTFTARKDYFAGTPEISTVTYKVISDMNTAFMALQGDQIDFCSLALPTSTVNQAEAMDHLKVSYYEGRALCYLGFNCAKEPFNNEKVRQAIAYALDKQAIIDLAEDGAGTVANSPWNAQTFGYSENVNAISQDLEKSKELLSEACYADGFNITLTTIDGAWKKVAEVIQEQLAPLGINVQIQLVDGTSVVGTLMKGDYDMQVLSLGLGGDASGWSAILGTSSEENPAFGSLNMFFYSSPEVDWAFVDANSSDDSVRLNAFQDVANTVIQDAPLVPLYFQKLSYVHSSDLEIGCIDGTGQFYVNTFHY